ncbi:MAG: hypothetical protein Athens071416_648 [Parcubacteria group bacterium Athens0714_16]|nr:MAG: hypothetical protein Athens071416_648 [Parcubacteria group bacterium Athens0714_16]
MFNKFEDYIKKPNIKRKLKIFSDGNDDYVSVLAEFFGKENINYGQLVKTRKGKKLVEKLRRIIYGKLKLEEIDTTNVECFNTILRNRISKLVRRSQCHAKNKRALENSLKLFQFYWNFIKPIKKKQTPAILENQTTKIWTWGNLLHVKLSYRY